MLVRKKRFPVGKAILLIFCLLLVSLAAAAAVCVGLAFTDHNSDRYTLESTDDSFPFDVLRGALTGSRFEVTEDKVNTYLNRFFCRRVQTGDEEPVLENIRLYFHEESDTELYARVYFRQHHFSVYAQISVVQEGADGEAAVQFRHVKLGELPLPDWVVDRIISGKTGEYRYIPDRRFANDIGLVLMDDDGIFRDLSHQIRDRNVHVRGDLHLRSVAWVSALISPPVGYEPFCKAGFAFKTTGGDVVFSAESIDFIKIIHTGSSKR